MGRSQSFLFMALILTAGAQSPQFAKRRTGQFLKRALTSSRSKKIYRRP